MARVVVNMQISCTVELPTHYERKGQACEDPAIEAALCGLTQHCAIFLWGEGVPPAKLTYEACEENCEIEEDEREAIKAD